MFLYVPKALAALLIKADLTNAEGYDPELFDMMLTILTIFPLVLLGVSMILEHCCSMSSTEVCILLLRLIVGLLFRVHDSA